VLPQVWPQKPTVTWRALEEAGFRRSWEAMLKSDDSSDDDPRYIDLRHHSAG
jgi:hypothetical protein